MRIWDQTERFEEMRASELRELRGTAGKRPKQFVSRRYRDTSVTGDSSARRRM
jgi:hypothetical protein